MTDPYTIPTHARIFRPILRTVFRGIFHLLSRVTLEGMENVPPRGPYLMVVNHVSLFEPPFILSFWPTAPEAVGAVDIWRKRGQSSLARLYGGIPVHRGEYDRSLIERMLAVLNSGKPLLIAPEGGRSHTPGLRRGMPGVAYVVEKTGVPVVPVGIVGATDDFLTNALKGERPHIRMRVGESFHVPAVEERGAARRDTRQRNVDLIMSHIAMLLPEEYRGVYSGVQLSGDGLAEGLNYGGR